MVDVRIEHDYEAQAPNELSLKKGDVVKDVVKILPGWYEGVCNDRKGVFPDTLVASMEENGVQRRNKKDVSRIRQCRVVFSYDADHSDELTLKVDDIINVIGEEEEGWWRGILNGVEGVFPSNFVEEIGENLPSRETEGKPLPLPAKPIKQFCEVKYSYKAQNEDELTLLEGDIITLLSKNGQDPGWWKGELNGKIGYFPDNFVVLLDGDEKKPKTLTEPLPIKPSSIASQRKSLEVKNNVEKVEKVEKSEKTEKTPPLPSKKPLISIKKSPSGSGIGILSEIKKKIVDVVDGATSSKAAGKEAVKAEVVENGKDGGKEKENDFDQVVRRPLLQDVRATRAKAPGRRPPTTIFKDDEAIDLPNGTASTPEPIEKTPVSSSPSETDGVEMRPRVREWEKHKAPWLEEMKLNQAKRTSTSPGPESKLKLSTPEKPDVVPPEDSPSEEKLPPVIKSKPVVPAPSKPSSASTKEKPKTEAKTPPKAPTPAQKPEKTEKPPEKLEDDGVVTHKQCQEILERISKLEGIVEKQEKEIEMLKNKLQVEKELRIYLQAEVEKVSRLVSG